MPARPIVMVSLTLALSLLGDSMLYAVLPAQYDVFGLPVVGVGLLLSINRYVRLLSNPLAGRLCDRVGIRVPFLAAVAAGALTTVVYGLAPGLVVMAAARLLWGGCWSVLRLGAYLTVLHHSSPAQVGRGMGAYNAISRIGSLAGMLVGGILADSLGGRPTLLLFGAVSVLGLLLAWPVSLDRVHAPQPAPRPRLVPAPPSRAGFLTGGNAGKLGLQVAALHLAALWVWLAVGLVISSFGLLLRLRFGDRIDLLGGTLGVATLAGTVLASRWVMDLANAPLSGLLVDRLGRRPAAAGFTAIAAGGLALLAIAPDLATTLAAIVVTFVGGGALVVVLDAAVGGLAPRPGRAAAVSRYATWADLGSASGPAIGYALVGTLGLPITYGLAALGLVGVMGGYVWATASARQPAALTRSAGSASES